MFIYPYAFECVTCVLQHHRRLLFAFLGSIGRKSMTGRDYDSVMGVLPLVTISGRVRFMYVCTVQYGTSIALGKQNFFSYSILMLSKTEDRYVWMCLDKNINSIL